MFAKHFQVETNWTALKSAITINLKVTARYKSS